MNKSQKDNFIRELDSNISKIIDSYRLLLKKGQVNLYESNNNSQHGLKESSCSVHDDLLLDVATFNIVSSLYYNITWSTLIWLSESIIHIQSLTGVSLGTNIRSNSRVEDEYSPTF